MMGDCLTDEQFEVLKIYRDSGAVVEFLTDFVEGDEMDPFIIPDHQRAAFYAIWDYSFVYLNWSRRAGKTFVTGNAPLTLGALLTGYANLKIGMYSGSFSQVKINFSELISTWMKSPFLQSITEKEPKIYNGYCEMRFKGYRNKEGILIQARPLNPQKKSDTTRGFGFPILFIDEFQLLPKDTYKAIMPQFAASGNPAKRAAQLEQQKRELLQHYEKKEDPSKNRVVLSGTSTFQFMPAYRIFSLIETRSKINRLAREFLDEFGEAA